MYKPILLTFLSLSLLLTGCSVPPVSRNSNLARNLYISSWFAPFDTNRGIESFTEHISSIDEINPVWYNLNPEYFTSGAAPFQETPVPKTQIITTARANGLKIMPTVQNWGVSNFDPSVISTIINSTTSRSRHVAEIVNLVLNNGYDGIDIDYENLPASSCQGFSAFITELGTSLHQYHKLLSVSLHPKTSSQSAWDGPGAQDWVVMARYADLLQIMVYDYHWASFHAGPIAPLDWLEDVLNYAQSVPGTKGKIIVGIPLYGYDWGQTGAAKALTYNDALNLMTTYNIINPSREPVYHTSEVCRYYTNNIEPHFQYQVSGETHTVYFQDVQALRERIDLINQYGDLVKGIAFWRLGGESPGVWEEVGRLSNQEPGASSR